MAPHRYAGESAGPITVESIPEPILMSTMAVTFLQQSEFRDSDSQP